jgi:cysteine synthase A
MIFRDVVATVGNTPLVELVRLGKGRPARVVAKLEMRNPCGSVKDRLGAALIDDAERTGRLRPGMTLVEATGGNTGIGLAFTAAVRGYRLILTMPQSMSRERVALLRHLGAEVVLTPGILMRDAVVRAEKLLEEIPGAVMLDQFRNPANPELHRRTTAVEIWEATAGAIDVFVAGVGTAILDEVIAVSDEAAFACARRLAREEGIVAGVSSGAALHAALSVASRREMAGKMIVVLLPDTGERYITTDLFANPSAQSGVAPNE